MEAEDKVRVDISNEVMEGLILKYKHQVKIIIRKHYYGQPHHVEEELYQVGLFGLYKAIIQYFKTNTDEFIEGRFRIYAYKHIRWQMQTYFSNAFYTIRIPGSAWDIRNKIQKERKRLKNENPGISLSELDVRLEKQGFDIKNWYYPIEDAINPISLDKPAETSAEECEESNYYNILPDKRDGIREVILRDYLRYIINTALTGFHLEHHKRIAIDWIRGVYIGNKPTEKELGEKHKLNKETIHLIIHNFIKLCRKVRDYDNQISKGEKAVLGLNTAKPERVKRKMSNKYGTNGISWNKNRNTFDACIYDKGRKINLGHYKQVEGAIKARRDAELKYYGTMDIGKRGGEDVVGLPNVHTEGKSVEKFNF